MSPSCSRCRRKNNTQRAIAPVVTASIFLLSSNTIIYGSAFTNNAIADTPTRTCHPHRPLPSNLYSGRHSHGYHLEPNAGPIPPECRLTESQIHTLLAERNAYKRRREYSEADKILAALNQCGVYVHDKRREWRADGKNHFGRRSAYVRRGGLGGWLSEEDAGAVSQMVEDRSYAKKRGEFHISDELTMKLKTRYRVKVDDKNREWSVMGDVSNVSDGEGGAKGEGNGGGGGVAVGGYYVPSPLAPPEDPTHTMDVELKSRIAHRLVDRASFRKKRDYGMADAILSELMEKYSIVVDDRTKEWKVINVDNVDDVDFAREARLSQRSAFVRERKNGENNGVAQQEKLITRPSAAIDDDDDDTTMPNDDDDEVEVGIEEQRRDLESLTVVELKEQLRNRGLPVSGKKADLILRLNAPDSE